MLSKESWFTYHFWWNYFQILHVLRTFRSWYRVRNGKHLHIISQPPPRPPQSMCLCFLSWTENRRPLMVNSLLVNFNQYSVSVIFRRMTFEQLGHDCFSVSRSCSMDEPTNSLSRKMPKQIYPTLIWIFSWLINSYQ